MRGLASRTKAPRGLEPTHRRAATRSVDRTPGHDAAAARWFLRRQLVLAGVAGAVVLVAVVGVGIAVEQGRGAAAASLRPTADGSGVITVSPAAESTRAAMWVAGAALVAVAAVLTLLLDHAFRVARFAVLARPGRPPSESRPPSRRPGRDAEPWL